MDGGSDVYVSIHHADCGTAASDLGKYHEEIFPIEYQNETLGRLLLSFPNGISLDEDDRILLQTLGRQLGVSLAGAKQEEEKRLLAVLQERNLIAQGLH
ncbi:hypothetical protein MM716_35765, partial [Klebsiella pneumoniae]|nr:hypothetical protein [Klebsiella pneumoniae]